MNTKDDKKLKSNIPLFLKRMKERLSTLKDEWKSGAQRQRLLKIAGKHALFALYGFFFARGEMLFGTFPLAIALIASGEECLAAAFAGALVSAFTQGREALIYAALYIFAFALRLYLKKYYKEQNRIVGKDAPLGIRVSLAVVCAFLVSLWGCFHERFSLHALMAMLFSMLAAGVFSFLFSCRGEAFRYRPLFKKISKIALLFALVYGVSSIRILTFSPAAALAAFLCFSYAEEGDFLLCGILGLVTGIACGKDYAPVMALLGLVSGALYRYSSKSAPWLGILAGFAWSFYSRGSSAFLYVLPDLVCGLLVYIPVSAYREKRKAEAEKAYVKNESKNSFTQERALGRGMEELSRSLAQLNEEMSLPEKEEARRIVKDALCPACEKCALPCHNTAELEKNLFETLFETGTLIADKHFKSETFCREREKICENANKAYALYLRRISAVSGAETASCSYHSVARLILDRENLEKERASQNEEWSLLFEKALKKIGITYERCSVCGKRGAVLKAENVSVTELNKSAEKLRELFESACGMKLSLPELTFHGGENDLVFYRLPAFQADFGYASERRDGQEFCGDSFTSFTADQYFYALLSDGMGSGKEASLVSQTVCRYTERYASCGASFETLVGAVNDHLLHSGCECSATFDLLRLDLYDGTADFVKCGACASLVTRADNVFKLANDGLPLGAVKEISFEPVRLRLKGEDRVYMMSDGVCEDAESAPFLSSLTNGSLPKNAEEAAAELLRLSKTAADKPDDRTVAVIDLRLRP